MALSKRTYTAGIKITAENLNAIQDAIIALEAKGITKDEIITALGYTPAKNSDIPTVPTADINANTSARHTHSNKMILDGITGQVTAEKVNNPDNTTDLVQYGAFQVAANQILAQLPTAITNDKIDEICGASVVTELFDKAKCTINTRFSGGTNEVSANGYYITDYMPASGGDSVKWVGALNNAEDKIAFYDSNKVALGYAYLHTTQVSSGSNPATYFDGNSDSGYTNKIGYVWTGAYSGTTKATYFDSIAYVRINSYVTKSTALTSTSDVPDHSFTVTG